MPTLYWCPHQVLKATGAPVAGKNRWWDHKGAIVLRWQPSYHKRSFDFTDYTFQVLSEQTIELLLLATKHKPGSLMSAFWKLAQVIWIFESWLGLFKAWTSFIKPATESSRELSVTGWGLTMEPLGASDLNEELEDDRQVSTDIIVATVCEFSPVKVWNKVWRIYFFWSSKQIAQLCMNKIFTYLATSIFPSKLSKFHRDELEQLRFDQLSNRIGNKLEIMTDFFSWFTQTTFFRISADQKFLAWQQTRLL